MGEQGLTHTFTMDCRKFLISIILIVTINTSEGFSVGESVLEVLQRVVKNVDTLKADNKNLKSEIEKLKEENQVLKDADMKQKRDNEELRADYERLKAEGQNTKAQVTHLNNNGYAQFSVSDTQWQSLHMAAVGACRSSTAYGGHGPYHNAVYPRTQGHTCDQVCIGTKFFTECDASMSIIGYVGRTKAGNQPSGIFYNYGCSDLGHPGQHHEEKLADTYIMQDNPYLLGYCCCRKP